jgi:hypothetical protein
MRFVYFGLLERVRADDESLALVRRCDAPDLPEEPAEDDQRVKIEFVYECVLCPTDLNEALTAASPEDNKGLTREKLVFTRI